MLCHTVSYPQVPVGMSVLMLCSLLLYCAYHPGGDWTSVVLLLAVLVHAAIFLLSAARLALPRPASVHLMGPDIIVLVIAKANLLVAPGSLAWSYASQFLESRKVGGPGSLSLFSLLLQILVLLVVALRWYLRLGAPIWGEYPGVPRLHYEWDFLMINYVLYVTGCTFLLTAYLYFWPH